METMSNFVVDLNHLDLLAITGEDSGRFLQGQLTCDVNDASPRQSILGAACNLKGRVMCSFRLLNIDTDYYLEMAPGLLDSNKANLDKYIVFYKAETADARPRFDRLGVAGKEAEKLLGELFPELPAGENEVRIHDGQPVIMVHPGGDGLLPRYELWLESDKAAAVRETLAQSLSEADFLQWMRQDIRKGIYHIRSHDMGEYTPQPLNYDLNGAVSFSKGCFTGQEIVARMHYRGKAKKRTYPVTISGAGAMPSQERLGIANPESGKRVGETLLVLPGEGDSREGLALIDCEAAQHCAGLVVENAENCTVTVGSHRG